MSLDGRFYLIFNYPLILINIYILYSYKTILFLQIISYQNAGNLQAIYLQS